MRLAPVRRPWKPKTRRDCGHAASSIVPSPVSCCAALSLIYSIVLQSVMPSCTCPVPASARGQPPPAPVASHVAEREGYSGGERATGEQQWWGWHCGGSDPNEGAAAGTAARATAAAEGRAARRWASTPCTVIAAPKIYILFNPFWFNVAHCKLNGSLSLIFAHFS